MPKSSPFSGAARYRPESVIVLDDVELPHRFSEPAQEYRQAHAGAALFDRSDRALLVVAGRDRKGWLHNLVTNAVKTLADGDGVYAFAVDVRGRIQFDVNILSLPDVLWLDLHGPALPRAKGHLERFHISEDVRLDDASAAYARLACMGPDSIGLAARLGAPQLPDWPALTHVALAADAARGAALPSDGARLMRHDAAALPGFELFVPRDAAPDWWDFLAGLGAAPAGFATLDVLRIEAGIPWPVRDLDESVVAPETGQVQRAVSYHKGCYLGQEVIERMRSRGSLARRLMRVELSDGGGLALPAPLEADGREAGRVTSLVRHPLREACVGLAYVRTSVSATARLNVGEPPRPVVVRGDPGAAD
jgi:folate-binding protein YgfZ